MKNIKTQIKITALLFGLLIFFNSFNIISAQTTEPVKKWNFLADIYIMFPYMDGETGIGNSITAPIDANPGDIFSKLKMAAMLYFEAETDKWAITSDLVYMNLNQEVTPRTILYSGDVTAKQFIWEAAGLYRIFPFFELGVGGRLNNLKTNFDIRRNVFPAGTEEYTDDFSKTWFDPILITRLSADIKDKWLFQFRGDLGGFGVGSDFTWQLQGYVGYRFTKVFQLSAGYRILSTDYKYTGGSKDFTFNVNEFGPVLRFGFNF